MRAARVARGTVHGLGEVLITLGVVLLLFAVYQLLWTNVETGQAQDGLRDRLAQQWRDPARTPTPTRPGGAARPRAVAGPALGDGVAVIRIPRLGRDWAWVVVEGVRRKDLRKGPGHYPGTALPGAVGNVGIAGHRTTYGAPFFNLDRLAAGDKVVLETRSAWFTYAVTRREIVAPSDTGVVLPVPRRPGARPTDRLLTLTTCHPRFSARQRMIVFGALESTQPKSAGAPAALTGAGS